MLVSAPKLSNGYSDVRAPQQRAGHGKEGVPMKRRGQRGEASREGREASGFANWKGWRGLSNAHVGSLSWALQHTGDCQTRRCPDLGRSKLLLSAGRFLVNEDQNHDNNIR